jgi:hypothetical protein
MTEHGPSGQLPGDALASHKLQLITPQSGGQLQAARLRKRTGRVPRAEDIPRYTRRRATGDGPIDRAWRNHVVPVALERLRLNT